MKKLDAEIVNRAKKGDRQAFNELVNKYHKAVYTVIIRMVHNPQEAQDLTQDTFLKAYRSLDSFNETYAFSTWLFKIATNLCIDFFRKRKLKTVSMEQSVRYKEDEIKVEFASSLQATDEQMIQGERSQLITRTIHQLPEKYRQVILLRHKEEKSYEEIAQMLNLPLGTVKARIFRAREMLKKKLKDVLF